MTDIFETKIMCKDCESEMEKVIVNRKGFDVRAVKCRVCEEIILHPADKSVLENYNGLRGKTYSVKLRMVGNSHAISIPKEIVNFINDMHRDMTVDMDKMVKLCFEDFGKLSVRFGNKEGNLRIRRRYLDRENEETR